MEIESTDNLVHALLDIKRHVVGVSFLHSADAFESCSAKPIKYKMPYCVMVRSACNGHDIKASADNFGCMGAARALGFIEPGENYLSGKHGFGMGMFCNLETAARASSSTVLIDAPSYGVRLAPLARYDEASLVPDVVIVVASPFVAMRLVEGYNYAYGVNGGFSINGNQALCAELTAFPLQTGNMNLSLLCSGTRNNAKWTEDEIGIAFPGSKFRAVVEGVLATVNPLERDNKKAEIQGNLEQLGISHNIEYGKNYDTGLYTFGKVKK